MEFIDQLQEVENRFESLTQQMADPAVIGDQDAYRKVTKAQREIEEIVEAYREYKKVVADLEEARLMREEKDADLRGYGQVVPKPLLICER